MRTIPMLAVVLAVAGCKAKTIDVPATEETGETGTVAGDDDDDVGDDDDDVQGIRFDAHIVAEILGAKFAATGDLDGDGTEEIVVGAWNNITEADIPYGWVSVLTYGGDLDTWTRTDAIDLGDLVRSPNQPVLGDIDGDGDLDIVVGFGSRYCELVEAVGACGGILVLENDNGTWNRTKLVDNSTYFYRGIDLGDLDGDGDLDMLAVAERLTFQEEESFFQVYLNDGNGSFGAPQNVGPGLGPFPTLVDIDGDGDLDVAGGEHALGDSFVWYEHDGANWERNIINDNFGKGNMVRFVENLYGDGVTRALATNHTNTESAKQANPDIYDSQLVAFDIPSNLALEWSSYTVLSDGILPIPDIGLFPNDAPGTFDVGDADGDGDLDILLAGDGDPTVYLLDQVAPGDFVTRVLRAQLIGNGGTHMVDFTGDGAVEFVVTSYGADQVFVIERIIE